MGSGKATVRNKMTDIEAKEILKLYRPGTADTSDPAFAEALAQCERDAQLKKWFTEHCALYSALRAKFREIQVPEGLREQIIAERKAHTRIVPLWQKAVLLAGAAAAVALIVFEIQSTWQPRERHDFAAFRDHMVGNIARGYASMDTNSSDSKAIRQFLAQKGDIADYELPKNLEKNAKPAGCVATITWRGKKVSMICFLTGRPLKAKFPSDLWLFVTDRSTMPDPPTATATTPAFKDLPRLGVSTASWTVGNRIYVLATEGDKELLSQFLGG